MSVYHKFEPNECESYHVSKSAQRPPLGLHNWAHINESPFSALYYTWYLKCLEQGLCFALSLYTEFLASNLRSCHRLFNICAFLWVIVKEQLINLHGNKCPNKQSRQGKAFHLALSEKKYTGSRFKSHVQYGSSQPFTGPVEREGIAEICFAFLVSRNWSSFCFVDTAILIQLAWASRAHSYN